MSRRHPGFVGCYALLQDPDYLRTQRAELKKQPLQFDSIGLGLLVIVMACWEVMLSKGQEWDWLGDPFWRVQTLLLLFAVGLGAASIIWEMRHRNPVVNFRPLGERNFAACCIIIFFCLRACSMAPVRRCRPCFSRFSAMTR